MNFRQYSKLYKWLAWGLTGFIVSVICCAVILTGDISLRNPFYNCGDVYEIREDTYKGFNVQDKGCQDVSGQVVLQEGEYDYGLLIEGDTNKWKYLCITLDEGIR